MSTTCQVLSPTCMHCQKATLMVLNADAVLAWRQGMLIQKAFPELSASDREILISGTHAECWDKMFGEGE